MNKLSVSQTLLKAKSYSKKGEVEQAQRLYQAILREFPKNKPAQQGLASLGKHKKSVVTQGPPQETINQLFNLYNQGNLKVAIEQAITLIAQYPKTFSLWNILGAANQRLGRNQAASEAFRKVIELNPANANGFNNLGVSLKDQGKFDEAIMSYKKALSLNPDYVSAYTNMGTALKDQGKFDEAIMSYKKVLSLEPDNSDAFFNMGTALQDQGKLDEAIVSYERAIYLKPDDERAYNNMGAALKDQGKFDEAIMSYKKALTLNPDYVNAYTNMGTALQDQGKFDEAIMSYKKVLSLEPDNSDAFFNMGTALQDQGKLDEAIVSYEKAISLKPDDAKAYNNMGTTLRGQSKPEEAIAAYNKALVINPDFADAHYNMGNVLQIQCKPKEAIESFRNALVIMPNFEVARTQKLYQQALICNWDAITEDTSLIPELGTSEKDVLPFDLLSLEDAPDRHFSRSKVYAKANYSQNNLPPIVKRSKRPKRIRIGYFSTDYKEHPVAYLIAKVLKKHNRNKFEIFGYSIHGSSSCEKRQQLKKSFDSFTDVQSISDRDIALQARRDEIDIAVDLNGYTNMLEQGSSRIVQLRYRLIFLGIQVPWVLISWII